MYQQYSGKRRYSNYTATSNGFTLTAYPDDPAKGEVQVTEVSTFSASKMVNNRSAQSNSENVFGSAGGQTGNKYKTYQVKAVPKQGYQFVRWNTGTYLTDPLRNPQTVTLSRNVELIACFAKVAGSTCTVNVQWNATMGSVHNDLMQNGSIAVSQGSSIKLKATPKAGYHFVKWTGGPRTVDGSTAEEVQFAVASNCTINAVFEADTPENPGGENPGGENPGGGYPGGNGGEQVSYTNYGIVKNDFIGPVLSFVKKWWWALLIVAYIVYDSKKGGPK